MVEESPESFISRWRAYAADVELFAHTEGSPLLECRAGGTVLQLFERTGPYLSRPGPAKVIINPGTSGLEPVVDANGAVRFESNGLGNITAVGRVVAREGSVVVIDAGVPLVVSVIKDDRRSAEAVVAEADDRGLVKLVSDGPVHGFVVSHGATSQRRAEAVDESI